MSKIPHTLLCPFLNDDPVFACGVEFGLLYLTMKKLKQEISNYFLLENQEQILLLVNRMGWEVVEMKPWEGAPDQWFWLHIRKLQGGAE